MRRSNSIGQVRNFISCYFSAIQNIIRIFDLLSNKVLKACIWNYFILKLVIWGTLKSICIKSVPNRFRPLPLLLYDPQASPVTSIFRSDDLKNLECEKTSCVILLVRIAYIIWTIQAKNLPTLLTPARIVPIIFFFTLATTCRWIIRGLCLLGWHFHFVFFTFFAKPK